MEEWLILIMWLWGVCAVNASILQAPLLRDDTSSLIVTFGIRRNRISYVYNFLLSSLFYWTFSWKVILLTSLLPDLFLLPFYLWPHCFTCSRYLCLLLQLPPPSALGIQQYHGCPSNFFGFVKYSGTK